MSADITITVAAKDLASATIANVAKSVDSNTKVLADVNNRAKLSSESVAGLSNALGDMGQNAGAIQTASENMAQFGLTSKVSFASIGANANQLLFVAEAGFKVGQALGNVVFETDKANEELAKAVTHAGELNKRLKQVAEVRFSDQKQDIELIRDPTEKVNAYKAVIAQIDAETAGLQSRISGLKKELKAGEKEEQDNALAIFGVVFDSRVTEVPKEIEKTQQEIIALSEKRLEIERQISERASDNDALRAQNALASKSESFIQSLQKELELQQALSVARGESPANAPSLSGEQKAKIGVTAGQQTFGEVDKSKATELLTSIELLKTEAQQFEEVQKEHEKLQQQQIQASERIAAAKQTELDKLQQERILLEQGKTAATAFALSKRGIDAESAAGIAAEMQKLDAQKIKADALLNIERERIRLTQGKEALRAFDLERKGLSAQDAKDIAGQEAALQPSEKSVERRRSEEAPRLQAFQSRLLTGVQGPKDDKMANIANRQVGLHQRQVDLLKIIEQHTRNTPRITVVGHSL